MKVHPPKTLRSSIQVLVFQDGLSSRSFEVPLAWFRQLGWTFGISLLVTILSLGAAVHFWRQGHRAQPERLKELEQQIRILGESRVSPVTPKPPEPAPNPTTPPVVEAAPVQPVTVSVSSTPFVAFRAFPSMIQGETPLVARPSIPIEITTPTSQWQGRQLKLDFDIRFTGREGQSQQGRILVLARGPEVLLAYPNRALSAAGSAHLFDPDKGEFFSVSRFRQTKVEFPAVNSPVSTIEILIFGADPIDGRQKLLLREILKAPPLRGGGLREAPEEG